MFNHPIESTIINSSEITGTVVQVDHHCHLKAWHLSPTCAGGHLRCLSHLENGEHHLLTPGEVGDITDHRVFVRRPWEITWKHHDFHFLIYPDILWYFDQCTSTNMESGKGQNTTCLEFGSAGDDRVLCSMLIAPSRKGRDAFRFASALQHKKCSIQTSLDYLIII